MTGKHFLNTVLSKSFVNLAIMNREISELCCGCLSVGRRMLPLIELSKKHCFMQIINEIPMSQQEDADVMLCFECEALIARFTKFKQQVKSSYRMLHDFRKMEDATKVCNISKLTQQRLIQISFNPLEENAVNKYEVTDVLNIEESKPSPIAEDDVKIESDDRSVRSDRSEDISLIEYKRRSELRRRSKKKRKRKSRKVEIGVFREVELSREELLEERRQQAMKEEYVNAMFKCDLCIVSFPNSEDMKDHRVLKHEMNASKLKCDICECSFSTEMSYNYHTNKHKRRYQCNTCDETYHSKRAVTKHYETLHCFGIDINLEIETKNQNGRSPDPPKVESTSDETTKYPCEFCNKMFKWKTSLRKHVETHRIESGQKRKPYCEPCRLSFTTTSNLQKHVKTSSKHQIQLKLRKLNEGGSGGSGGAGDSGGAAALIRASVMSARQKFACEQCDKRFQWRGNLLRHVYSHAARANGELVCAPCNRTFSSIATYKQHMEISKKHVSESDFKYMCNECGKKFANKTRLKDHIDWEHLKNYVHACSVCQKIFKSHTSLYLHKQVVHKKDGVEHLCDHCGKSFPNHAKLRSHITALHTTQSPYKCTICPARFSWHSCLSRHVRRVHRRKSNQ